MQAQGICNMPDRQRSIGELRTRLTQTLCIEKEDVLQREQSKYRLISTLGQRTISTASIYLALSLGFECVSHPAYRGETFEPLSTSDNVVMA